MISIVEVTRGGVVESRHVVHIAVVHATRGLIASSGDAGFRCFARSSIKMFQALPLVEDGVVSSLGVSDEELALCTASHNAEPVHVETAHRLLARAGCEESDLACGAHEPMYGPAAQRLTRNGIAAGRIHNNCSGKHAGMLALARTHGWNVAGYHQLEHPVQQRVQRTLAAWTGVDALHMGVAVDGCGLPTFALPLDRVALACARFAAAATGEPAAIVGRAMTSHPMLVAGTGRLCTAVMALAKGRLFAKVGAEGYYVAGVPEQQLGVALKVEDGARRAAEPALLSVLRTLDVLSDNDLDTLGEFANPLITNTRGETVGQVQARITLR